MKKYILIILIFNFLQSCSSVSEGFKLKKEKSFEEKISNKDSKNENQEENTASNSTEELILKNIKKNDSN